MSISLTLLPVALALRIVMGKENFENWVAAQQVLVATNLTSEDALLRGVKGAGFDAAPYGKSFKTHFGEKGGFFFWECIEGKWVASFSKYDPPALIRDVIKRIEAHMGQSVFADYRDHIPSESSAYPTNFVDGELLKQTLIELGGDPVQSAGGTIKCQVEGASLLFSQEGTAPYSVKISGVADMQGAYLYLSDLDEEYRKSVQTAVYQKVKATAGEHGLMLEQEEVLPDRSIVLTLRLEG